MSTCKSSIFPPEPPVVKDDTSSAANNNMIKHLTCPLCHSVPDDPVYLMPCEHLMCRGCVTPLGTSFPCPTCHSSSSNQLISPLFRGTLLYRLWTEALADQQNHHAANHYAEENPPQLVSVTKTVHVKELNGLFGLKMMLVGMVAGFAMHVFWPLPKQTRGRV